MARTRLAFKFCLCTALFLAPRMAAAGDAQFDAIVQRIKSHYQKGPIPMMGLASFVVNRVHPAGMKKIQIAVFEDLDPTLHPPESGFDSFIQHIAGPEFHPMVRVFSRRDGEQTFIYTRALEDDVELLIVTVEKDEATVVKARLSPSALDRWIRDPGEMASKSSVHSYETPEP